MALLHLRKIDYSLRYILFWITLLTIERNLQHLRDTDTSKQTNKCSACIICTVFLEYFQPQSIENSDAQVLEYNKKLNRTLSGTKIISQQDIQTPSHFKMKK